MKNYSNKLLNKNKKDNLKGLLLIKNKGNQKRRKKSQIKRKIMIKSIKINKFKATIIMEIA